MEMRLPDSLLRDVAEPRKERVARIARMFDDLAEDYGREGIQELTAMLHNAEQQGYVPKGKEIAQWLEGKRTRQDFSADAQQHLRRLGVLDDANDFSLEQFMQRKFSDLRNAADTQFSSTRIEYLANAFRDTPVRLVEKPELGDKPLMYSPKHTDDAFSIEKIKAADFHIGFWEIPRWLKNTNALSPGAHDRFKALDAALAAAIFHPRYGDGQRNANGVLEVRYADGTRAPITGKWFDEQSGFGLRLGDEKNGSLLRDRPLETLSRYAPELFSRGLLHKKDFQTRLLKLPEEQTAISTQGQVRIDGISYTLGKDWTGKKIRIDKITNNLAAVVQLDDMNVGTPVAAFRLFDRKSPEVNQRATGKSFTYDVSKAHTAVRPYDRRALIHDIEVDDRANVLRTIERYEQILALDNDLKRNGHSLRSLPPELFQKISRSVLAAEHAGLIAFAVKESGDAALESSARLATDKDFFEPTMRAFTFLEEGNTEISSTLRDAVREREALLTDLQTAQSHGDVDDATARRLRYDINSRFGAMLTVVSDAKRTTDEHRTLEKMASALRLQSDNFALFGKILRDAIKGSSLELHDLKNLQTDYISSAALSPEDLHEMERILEMNWSKQKPESVTNLKRSLQERHRNSSDLHYVLVRKDGRLAGFMSFDRNHPDIPKGASYGDALNVNPDLLRSGIGKLLLRDALAKESAGREIYAHANPSAEVASMYVNELGLIITGVDIDEDGQPWLRLVLREPRNQTINSDAHEERVSVKELANALMQYTKDGFIATRLTIDPKDPNSRLVTLRKDL